MTGSQLHRVEGTYHGTGSVSKIVFRYWLSLVWSKYRLYLALPSYILGNLFPQFMNWLFNLLGLESVVKLLMMMKSRGGGQHCSLEQVFICECSYGKYGWLGGLNSSDFSLEAEGCKSGLRMLQGSVFPTFPSWPPLAVLTWLLLCVWASLLFL